MRDKPLGVKIISVLSFIGSGLLFMLALLFVFVAMAYPSLLESGELEQSFTTEEVQQMQALGDIAPVFYAVAVITVLFAMLYLAIGIGLWKGKNWARILTIALSMLWIILSIFGLIFYYSLMDVENIISSVIELILAGLIIWYLIRNDTIVYFRTSKQKK